MRVIAGEFRSRRLKSLPGLDTRPTPDRLRETLFNVLASLIPKCVFMDVYAGTGAVGIEALSRGARRAIFIEKNRAAVEVIHENLAALGLEGRAEVFTSKATTVKYLNDLFDWSIGVVKQLTPADLTKTLGAGKGPGMTGLSALLNAMVHTAHTRGYSDLYLRSKNVKPPTYAV